MMPIFYRMFSPMMFAFLTSTIKNGADCMVHPPDSTAIIIRPFGKMCFPL